MSKRNNFTGVNNRVNARGVAFIKSRKSIDNVKTILNDMDSMANANGISLTRWGLWMLSDGGSRSGQN